MQIIGKRIKCAGTINLARVEVLVGNNIQDGEWVGFTNFMDIGICEQVIKMINVKEK